MVETKNSWLLSRVSARLITALLGGGLGWWFGQRIGYPATTGVFVGAVAVLSLTVFDTLKGYKLLDWLRTPEADTPNLPGLWGEVGHRIYRVLRNKDMQLAEEQRRLHQFLSAIQASPNGLLLLDENEHITWISDAAADHFGLDPVRDLRQRVTNLIRQPAFVQYLQSRDYKDPVKCLMPRGMQGFISVQARSYGDGQTLILSQDITERERADNMRRDFVANVSHEIRTPLTVLSGFIETLASLPLTEVERTKVIGLMSQQADRMQTLVADLLTLAQIEGSPRPASDRWTSVASLMRRLQVDAEGLSRGRHPMTFTIDGQGREVELAGVESEWISAMGNLVSNAVRYTPDGGGIDVRWVCLPEGGGEFSVRDGGIGIETEHIPRLTERFYRVDSSRSRGTGGTGLGLSIVKHVVQRHGGELKITSEPGKGSTFAILVPAARVKTH